MKIIEGDLFALEGDCLCVPTNGIVSAGKLIMGAGVAKEFRDKYRRIDYKLGDLVSNKGNHCYLVKDSESNQWIMSFPTKNHFMDASPLKLVVQSAREAVVLADAMGLKNILLPAPGCGLGGLDWETQVKPAIEDILDDRFTVVMKPKRKSKQ